MIRINLLPVRQVRKARAGQRQMLVVVVLLVIEVVAMFFIYESRNRDLVKNQKVVTRLNGEIGKLKQKIGDFNKLKGQRDRLIAQRNVINKLHAGRTGPVRMLRELSDILSVGKGPTVDQTAYEELLRRDPNAGFNPRWNPRRLWIQKIDEKALALKITGRAKDHDDVAELLKRLQLSIFFDKVELESNRQVVDKTAGSKVIAFSVTCTVKYK